MAARLWCSWIDLAFSSEAGTGSRRNASKKISSLIIDRALASRVLRRGRGLGFLAAFGCRQQPLPLALPHILIVLRGAGARWRVRGHAADRGRNGVADTGRDFLVDRAATGHAAARE